MGLGISVRRADMLVELAPLKIVVDGVEKECVNVSVIHADVVAPAAELVVVRQSLDTPCPLTRSL